MEKTVLDVGQCGVDGPRLETFLSRGLHCRVDSADTIDDAIDKLTSQHYDLCLVNRKLAFEGSSGVDLIAAAKDAGVATPIMLVSDREDAQEEATELGALPGFGKSQLDDPQTVQRLRDVLRDN